MTDPEIIAAYLAREKRAMRKPQGADHMAILEGVAKDANRPLCDVRRLVLDAIFSDPN